MPVGIYKRSIENRKNLSISHKGQKPWNTGKKRPELSGKNHPRWKGGRTQTEFGYILLLRPNHPNCNHAGYVPEHRLIMEKHLGRYLDKKEHIHHKNAIKHDNRIKNLQIVSNPHLGEVKCPHCNKIFLIH